GPRPILMFVGLCATRTPSGILHDDFHSFAGRHSATGRILREILPLCCRVKLDFREHWFALAGSDRYRDEHRFALLLPAGVETNLCSPGSRRIRSRPLTSFTADACGFD